MGRKTRKWTTLTAAALLASCTAADLGPAEASLTPAPLAAGAPGPGGEPAAPVDPEPARVALVTVDGVRPEEALGGGLPGLAALAAHGYAIGRDEPFEASGPHYVSLPGYAEILTGIGPSRCKDNGCEGPGAPTLVDRVAERFGAGEAAVVASWDALGRVARLAAPGALVSAGRALPDEAAALPEEVREPMERAAEEGPAPGHGGYRADARTAEIALAYARARAPRFFFVGLGDTDEHAHAGDRRGYEAALARADAFVAELTRVYAARGGRWAIVVTSDHGRSAGLRDHGAAWPESRRTWMVAGGTVRPVLAAPRGQGRLRDVAPAILDLLGS